MSSHGRPRGARLLALATALGAASLLTAPIARGDGPDEAKPLIEAIIYDRAVSERISAWGLSTADVQHDVDALSREQRRHLAQVLNRRWRSNESHSQADLQAQFLVMLSLMRESTLFASIVSGGPARLR